MHCMLIDTWHLSDDVFETDNNLKWFILVQERIMSARVCSIDNSQQHIASSMTLLTTSQV